MRTSGTLVGLSADGGNPNAVGLDDVSGLTGHAKDTQAKAYAYHEQGFTWDSGGAGNPNLDPGMTLGPWGDVPIASATYASSTQTATINTSATHFLKVGQFFSIYNTPGWNGRFQITEVTTPTQFKAFMPTAPTGAVTGGRVHTSMYHRFEANRNNFHFGTNVVGKDDAVATRMGRLPYRDLDADLATRDVLGQKDVIYWADIAAGLYDAYITQSAQDLLADPAYSPAFPFLYAFHHEMNANNSEQRGAGDPSPGACPDHGCGWPDHYVAAWRRIRQIFDAVGATVYRVDGSPNGGNTLFVWTPTRSMYTTGGGSSAPCLTPWNFDPSFNKTYSGTAPLTLAGDGLAYATTAYGTVATAIAGTPTTPYSVITILVAAEAYVPSHLGSTWFKIGNEYFIATGRTTGATSSDPVTWQAQRASMGSSAAAHPVGTAVEVIHRYADVIGTDCYQRDGTMTADTMIGPDAPTPTLGTALTPPGTFRAYLIARGTPGGIYEWGQSAGTETYKATLIADVCRKLKLWWNGPWGAGSIMHWCITDEGGGSNVNFFTTSQEYSAAAAYELQDAFFGGPRAGIPAPSAPTGLVAVPGAHSVALDWNDNSPTEGITVYRVYQLIPLGANNPVASVAGSPPASKVTVGGLASLTGYQFVVTAVNSSGESAPSAPVNVVTTSGGGGPGSGIGRVQSAGASSTGTGRVKVTWPVPTQAGDLLVAVVSLTDSVVQRPATPAGWTMGDFVPSVAGQLSESIAVFYIPTASSRSGEETFRAQQGTPDMDVEIIEVSGIRDIGMVDVTATASDSSAIGSNLARTGQTPTITFNDEYVLGALAARGTVVVTDRTAGFARIDSQQAPATTLVTWDMVTRVPGGSLQVSEILSAVTQWAGLIISFKGPGAGRYMRRSGTILGIHEKGVNQGAPGSSQTPDCGSEDNRWTWYAFGTNSDGSDPTSSGGVANPYPLAHHLEATRIYSGFPTPVGGQDPTPNRNSSGGDILPLSADSHNLCRGRIVYHNLNAQYGPDNNHKGLSWADVAAGVWDNFLYSCANGLKALGPVTGGGDGSLSRAFPYLFSFHHDCGINSGTTQPGRMQCGIFADYKAAYQHVREVFDAVGISVYSSQLDSSGAKVLNPNGFVYFVWSPDYHQFFDVPDLALVGQDRSAAYTSFLVDPNVGLRGDGFPPLGGPGGRDYYDIVGTDPYPDSQKPNVLGRTAMEPEYYFGDPDAAPDTGDQGRRGHGLIPYALARNKPIWIGEYGPQHMSPAERTTFFNYWFNKLIKGVGWDADLGIFPNYDSPSDPLALPGAGSFVGIAFTDEPTYEFDEVSFLPGNLINDPYLHAFQLQGKLAFFGGNVGRGAGETGGGVQGSGQLTSAAQITGVGKAQKRNQRGVGNLVSVGQITGQPSHANLDFPDTTGEMGTELSVPGNIEIGKTASDIVYYVLTVAVLGGGAGIIRSVPPGILIPGTESALFIGGTTVTLTATADGESNFLGWGGSGSGTGPLVITITGDTFVTAEFDLIPIDRVGTLVSVGALRSPMAGRQGELVSVGSLRGRGTVELRRRPWEDEFAPNEGVTPWSGRRVQENVGPMGD